jgi:hypothetical protein
MELAEDKWIAVFLQILGVQRASNRFLGGGQHIRDLTPRLSRSMEDSNIRNPLDEQVNPHHLHLALGEAMNFFASADWALGEVSGLAKDWPARVQGGALIAGFRYARNAIHHDHAKAIDFCGDSPGRLTRVDIFGLDWAEPESGRLQGRNEFRRDLLGEPIVASLGRLICVLVSAAELYLLVQPAHSSARAGQL